ncbi:DUF5522 domain-containing protein [Sediminibacterium sp.]|uniref:DUF5522 domain-containing protein n=1 Tax=Sediminibacterium sp. TaxID=1917865 RepID=UPI0025F2AFAA|nr:DUF5522 domain-containing protein [Sediminibacterium sp.]
MNRELIEGKDFYYDEKGYMVFTAEYHLNKGHCCGYGCRHCPYDYDCVPEPKRSALLEEKANTV